MPPNRFTSQPDVRSFRCCPFLVIIRTLYGARYRVNKIRERILFSNFCFLNFWERFKFEKIARCVSGGRRVDWRQRAEVVQSKSLQRSTNGWVVKCVVPSLNFQVGTLKFDLPSSNLTEHVGHDWSLEPQQFGQQPPSQNKVSLKADAHFIRSNIRSNTPPINRPPNRPRERVTLD